MPESKGRAKPTHTHPPQRRSKKTSMANPPWFVPMMLGLMVVGLLWVVTFYITAAAFPIRTRWTDFKRVETGTVLRTESPRSGVLLPQPEPPDQNSGPDSDPNQERTQNCPEQSHWQLYWGAAVRLNGQPVTGGHEAHQQASQPNHPLRNKCVGELAPFWSEPVFTMRNVDEVSRHESNCQRQEHHQ